MELQRLYEELGEPSKQKLLLAARKRGLDVSKKDVDDLKTGVRQLFGKQPPQKGAHATNQGFSGGVWQSDLIDYSQMSKTKKKIIATSSR
jgi:hypothetical protein